MFPHFLPPDRVAVFKPVVRRHLAARQLVRVLELARGKKDPPFPSVDDSVPCCRVSVRERTRDGWTKEELERAGAMAFTMGESMASSNSSARSQYNWERQPVYRIAE